MIHLTDIWIYTRMNGTSTEVNWTRHKLGCIYLILGFRLMCNNYSLAHDSLIHTRLTEDPILVTWAAPFLTPRPARFGRFSVSPVLWCVDEGHAGNEDWFVKGYRVSSVWLTARTDGLIRPPAARLSDSLLHEHRLNISQFYTKQTKFVHFLK